MMDINNYFDHIDMPRPMRKYHALKLQKREEMERGHEQYNAILKEMRAAGKVPYDCPDDDPLKVKWKKSSDLIHNGGIKNKYKPKMDKLWAKLTDEQKKEYEEAWHEFYMSDDNAQPTCDKDPVSPCGKYRLQITQHPTEPGCWSYTKAKVFVKDGDEWRQVQEVERNYHSFWFHFMTHSNGKDYLWCGENYQGYTLVELPSGHKRTHIPKAAEKGFGFCWTGMQPSPDGKILAVDGCFWACPYEVVFYDFSDPDMWPVVEMGRMDLIGDHDDDEDEGDGEEKAPKAYYWTEDGTEFVGRAYHCFRKADGVDLSVLYEEEKISEEYIEDMPREEKEWRTIPDIWKRPSGPEMYADAVKWWEHQKKHDVDLTDITMRLEGIWNLMSEEDRGQVTPIHEIAT